MHAFALLAFVAVGVAEAVPNPQGPIYTNPALFGAFFEFAPASGNGMTAACACTTPTGAKGEAMTFARASSGTCLKGNTTTGIANGDMVTCSTNQPRVMPGGDGTGGLGLLVEGARTNVALRSQEIDNAAVWVPSNSGSSNPVVTANAATAPDGTATAERVQLPAISAGWSLLQQPITFAAAAHSGTFFTKGNGQSGTFIMFFGAHACVTCSYNPSTWTRCTQENINLSGASNFNIGQDIVDCGAGSFGTQDFFLWGGQAEVGAFASSYIATAGAAVTRAAETATFSVAIPIAAGSAAGTIVPEWSTGAAPSDAALLASTALGGQLLFMEPSGANRIYVYDGTTVVRTTGDFAAGTAARLWSSWTGSTMTIQNSTAGTSGSGTFDGAMGGNFSIGADQTLFQAFGVLKQLCGDSITTRCR